jgi:hypothetical protein
MQWGELNLEAIRRGARANGAREHFEALRKRHTGSLKSEEGAVAGYKCPSEYTLIRWGEANYEQETTQAA